MYTYDQSSSTACFVAFQPNHITSRFASVLHTCIYLERNVSYNCNNCVCEPLLKDICSVTTLDSALEQSRRLFVCASASLLDDVREHLFDSLSDLTRPAGEELWSDGLAKVYAGEMILTLAPRLSK